MVDTDDGGATPDDAPVTDDAEATADPGPDATDGGPGGLEGDPGPGPADTVTISRRQLVIGAQVALVLVVLLVVGLVLVTKDDGKDTGATVTATGKDGGTDAKPKKPEWPPAVGGRPPFLGKRGEGPDKAEADAPAGVYVWADYDGWHVWVVGGEGKAAAKGRITSDEPFSRGAAASDGQGTVTKNEKSIEFDFATATAHAAGVDFNPGFFSKTLLVDVDGDDLPVFTGRKPAEATSPVVLTKAPQG
jgi:hypothetical protein